MEVNPHGKIRPAPFCTEEPWGNHPVCRRSHGPTVLSCGHIWRCFLGTSLMHSFEAKHRKPLLNPIGSMYAIYGNIYHQFTPNVSIYTIHGSYGIASKQQEDSPVPLPLRWDPHRRVRLLLRLGRGGLHLRETGVAKQASSKEMGIKSLWFNKENIWKTYGKSW